MSTREDLRRFYALKIDFESLGLIPSQEPVAYFCTPADAEIFATLGVDGIHFILLPGDERVFCVDPSMGEIGTYVLPVAENFRQFLSFILYSRDANAVSQIYWLSEERFRQLLKEGREAQWPGCEEFFAREKQALAAIREAFELEPVDPYGPVKAMQAAFDPSVLRFTPEYYDVLGLDMP